MKWCTKPADVLIKLILYIAIQAAANRGGAQLIDVTASTNDDLMIVDVDTTNQVALVRPLIPSLGGVV